MPYKIPKDEMPAINYNPIKYRDNEIALVGITNTGPVIIFDKNDIRYCPWDEIAAWAEKAPIKENEVPDKKIREVKPANPKS